MNRNTRIRRVLIVFLMISVFLVSSCVTQDHMVTIEPIDSSAPVSGSSSFLRDGGYVGPEEYELIEHVSFTVESIGTVSGKTEDAISIDDQIDELVDSRGGDAMVNFGVYAQTQDPGNLGYVIFTRIFGGMMTGMGLPFLFLEYTVGTGAAFVGVGGTSLLVSFILPSMSESRWTIRFEGDVVQETY